MEVSPCCDRLCVCSAPQALIGDKLYSAAETWELKDLVVSSSSKDSGKHLTSTATVTLYDASAREEDGGGDRDRTSGRDLQGNSQINR